MKRCDVHLAPEFLMFRVHFQPGALFRLLGIPLYEFGEDYFDAELVLSSEVRDVSERWPPPELHRDGRGGRVVSGAQRGEGSAEGSSGGPGRRAIDG
jgi:hypothetical protein